MNETEQEHIFNSWIRQHKALLFKVVKVYAFTTEDQDDLFQDIVIQVWRSIPAFRHDSAVTTWLYRIALNIAIKWVRKEQKHHSGRQPISEVSKVLQENTAPVDGRLSWLYEEIASLNEIDRSITLLFLDGFSYRDMAEIIGISENNIGVKINRIKKYLIIQSNKLLS